MAAKFLVVTGETSAEVLTSPVLKEIKNMLPDATFWGLGGDILQTAGLELIAHSKALSVMGFFDIFKIAFNVFQVYRKILKELKKRGADIAIFVDYPGFNMRLAEKLYTLRGKERKPKLVYYVTPQVWAWNWKRIEKLKRYFDYLIPALPFEYYLFKNEGLDNRVKYFGHPLVSIVKPSRSEEEFRNFYGIKNEFIVLMPGSRKGEVKRILPVLLKSFVSIRSKLGVDGVLILAPYVKSLASKMAYGIEGLKMIDGPLYDPIFYGKLAIVGSGSAALECAIANIPLIVVYKTDWLTYHLAKPLIKVPYISLVNIIAERMIVPEFIQADANVDKIVSTAYLMLEDEALLNKVRANLKYVSSRLGTGPIVNEIANFLVQLVNC